MNIFFPSVVALYSVIILGLFYFAAHLYVLLLLYLKNRQSCTLENSEIERALKVMKDWPKVTVQLPVFNEYYVVERLLDCIALLDYPRNKLQIQVLDDSTDETADLAKTKVARYKKEGFHIDYIHRTNRAGHKAGAMKEAMDKATGSYIAIFDADFLPPADFLKKTVPHFFLNEKLGMVQTRWGHTNREYSMLTRAQSIGIDGHFVIEHTARNGSGLWMNFNGTAGVWKKECILNAGNWENDTLTEDLDLSYRALMRGWEFKYYWNVVSPAELPPTIAGFKSQQFRWCKGSIQTAKKLLPRILKSKQPCKIKAEATTHLLAYSVHPLMVLNILFTLPMLLLRMHNEWLSGTIIYAAVTIMAVSTFAPILFYAVSQKAIYPDWSKRLRIMPVLTMIGTGIALNNTRAWLEAVFGKNSEFVRTPKLKVESKSRELWKKKKYAQNKLDLMIFLEILLGFYILFTLWIAYQAKMYALSPFLFLYAAGFFYVAFLNIYDYLKPFFLQRNMKPDLQVEYGLATKKKENR